MANGLSKQSALLALMLPICALAEELPDPTRPPVAILAPSATGAIEAPATGLQSVIISGHRRAAIIDGETVELGRKHGDARLIEVNESSVVLKGSQGRQVLTLFPGVKMTSKVETKAKPPVAADKVQSGKHKTKPVARKEGK
ncbi:hypothetical protein FGKAn22_03480 [Ferrigenium kumadai]|uniref:MSHA biogenesis protein MshK n=1 Tax=Ferrigenium kumadai TaxID=1682490 RepID=A0AAN1SYW9_9PROT|nr:hypothetical protein [Ferrigenium kumadai]BBI98655.1 hypothetical protein FGKAn22_03480 [Ferrigenium kumadai]